MQHATPEVWQSIPSLDGLYEASSLGRIRRGNRVLHPALHRRGRYWHIASSIGSRERTHKVHQLVAEAFHGPRPSPKHEVNHRDGDRLNNHADNLEWATRRRNLKHSYAIGLRPRLIGAANGRAKLTEKQVAYIRTSTAPSGQLAGELGINRTTVHRIRTGRSW